ncbi:MAG TPA: hypothetical protein VEA38_02205 [Terriglobales bacterium]|nr:hypothetical protein [Terriglobales bacterium]
MTPEERAAKAVGNFTFGPGVDDDVVRAISDGMAGIRRNVAAAIREALSEAARFLDVEVREWLPSEHTNCAVDSGCAHGYHEREMYERLDAMVATLRGDA